MTVDEWQWGLIGLLFYHSMVLRFRVRTLEHRAGEHGWVARWL